MCVMSLHHSAEMMSLMWCQFVRISPATYDMFAERTSELKLFQIGLIYDLVPKTEQGNTQAVKKAEDLVPIAQERPFDENC